MKFNNSNSLNWSVIGVWGTKIAALIIFFALANILSPEDFGMVALAIGVASLFQNMFISSFGGAVVQAKESTFSYLDTAFWLCFGLSIVFGSAIFFGANLIAQLTSISGIEEVFELMALVVVLNGAAAIQHSYLIRTMGFRALAFRSLGAIVISGAAGIGAALYGLGWLSLVIQQIVLAGMNCVFLWAASRWKPKIRFSVADAKASLAFSKWMLLWALISFFERQTDILVVSSAIGAAAAGYYSTGQRTILLLVELLSGLAGQLFFPLFAKLQENKTALTKIFYDSAKAIAALMLPAYAGLACVAPEAVEIVLGEKWLPSVPVLRWLALYGAIVSVCFLNFTLMTALNKPQWVTGWAGLLMTLNIILMIPAVHYGFTAVAAVLAIRTLVVMPLSILSVRRLIPISLRDYALSFVPVLVGTLGMILAIMLARYLGLDTLSPLWRLLILIPLGGVVYFATLNMLHPKFIPAQLAFLKNLNR